MQPRPAPMPGEGASPKKQTEADTVALRSGNRADRGIPTLGVRVEIDFRDAEAAVDPLALHDDIDQQVEELANVLALEILAAFALLHQQRELLKREPRRVGVNRRDRARMTGVHISDVGEGRPVPQLLEEDAIGPHAQTAFEKIFGANLGLALAALRVEQPDVVGLR